MSLGLRDLQPQRKCENGEVLDIRPVPQRAVGRRCPRHPPPAAPVMQGGAASLGMRDVGVTSSTTRKR